MSVVSYPVTCPHCGKELDSLDSLADSMALLDRHLEARHPDLPDPRHDPRWDVGGAS